jgi:hypothetical protein
MGNFLIANLFVTIVFVIIYIGLMGGLGAWLAEKKGYSSGSWFFLCVLTGPVGLIALAGAPSRGIESSLEEIKRKLEAQSSDNSSGGTSAAPLPSAKISGQTWFCRKCQTENPAAVNSCKGCGEYR